MDDAHQMAEVRITREGNTVTLTGFGSLDFANTEELHRELKNASGSADSVVVDLRAVDFIDTAVLEYLARAGKAMLRRGKHLEIVCLEGGHPLYVLEVSNFGELLTVRSEPGKAQD